MAFQFDATTRNAELDQITAAVGSAGVLNIYSGSVPANVAAGLGGATLLAALTCGSPFAPAASSGVLTATNPTTANAGASGTATFFRVTNSGGTAKIQGTVGTSGADLNLNSTAIASGGPVVISSLVITAVGA